MADHIPLFPLHSLLLPHTDLGLHVFEARYRQLVTESLNGSGAFGVALIRQGVWGSRTAAASASGKQNRGGSSRGVVRSPTAKGAEVGGPAEPHEVGTLARIAGYARLPDGRYLLEVEGTRRFAIRSVEATGSYPSASVCWLPEPIGNFAQARSASDEVESLVFLYRSLGGDGDLPVRLSVDPVVRSYQVASLLGIDPPEKQILLELASAAERLEAEVSILRREITLLDHIRSGQR